jgi:hypothetical protein
MRKCLLIIISFWSVWVLIYSFIEYMLVIIRYEESIPIGRKTNNVEDIIIEFQYTDEEVEHLLWPIPKQLKHGQGTIELSCKISINSLQKSPLLDVVVKEFYEAHNRLWKDFKCHNSRRGVLKAIHLNISDLSESMPAGWNEEYNLSISQSGAFLRSVSIYGVMRGLVSSFLFSFVYEY